jgi:hypothetical protein
MVSLSSLSRIRPLKLSTKPFCIGFPGVMQCHSIRCSEHDRRMAVDVSSVPLSETIIPGFLRRSIRADCSRATRRPDIEVPGIAASARIEVPPESWALT